MARRLMRPKQVTIRLATDEAQSIAACAQAEQRTVGELCRILLLAGLDGRAGQRQAEGPR